MNEEITDEAAAVLKRSSKMKEAVKYSLQQQIEGGDALALDAVAGTLGVLFELTVSAILLKCAAGKDFPSIMQKLLEVIKPVIFADASFASEESQEMLQLLSCFLDSEGQA